MFSPLYSSKADMQRRRYTCWMLRRHGVLSCPSESHRQLEGSYSLWHHWPKDYTTPVAVLRGEQPQVAVGAPNQPNNTMWCSYRLSNCMENNCHRILQKCTFFCMWRPYISVFEGSLSSLISIAQCYKRGTGPASYMKLISDVIRGTTHPVEAGGALRGLFLNMQKKLPWWCNQGYLGLGFRFF